MNRKEAILERALVLFNEKGVEYGGMRELAALMGMRVSNITYYFATKDDLAGTIMERLAQQNNEIFRTNEVTSLRSFLDMYRVLFLNQYKYRCLFISFVHLFTHHPGLAEKYKQTNRKRKQGIANACTAIIRNGDLKKDVSEHDIQKLVAHISLLARFWISESIVSYYDRTIDENINHYLSLMCDIFLPYTTAKGKREINGFLGKLQ